MIYFEKYISNVHIKLWLHVFICSTFFLSINAQDTDYFKQTIRFEDFIYKSNIKTVLLNLKNDELALPIIPLGSRNALRLQFDDLDNFPKDYSYELILCNYNWEPVDLLKAQYINGVTEDFMNTTFYSSCVYSQYINYQLDFPTSTMEIAKSGNYIIKVFEDGDKDNLVLTKRFMVVEPKVLLTGEVRRSANVEFSRFAQDVSFVLTSNGYALTNPYSDLKVNVIQNNDWASHHENIKPLFVKGNEIEYLLSDENMFLGINEYRSLDLKSINYTPGNMSSIELGTPVKAFLYTDQKRGYRNFEFLPDINGKRYIRNEIAFDHHSESEYVEVQFSLSSDMEYDEPVYLYGALCEFPFNNMCKLNYDDQHKVYYKNVLIKQGLYNYAYVFQNQMKGTPDFSVLEGNHWQTENKYTIMVYHKSFSAQHDRLIGVLTVSSIPGN